uniref:Immunoglobulin I-set domain-containing protein n=1 Tax=Phocoena sinus TaxID=42100 RepID=A0A8C9CT22_PHOSS
MSNMSSRDSFYDSLSDVAEDWRERRLLARPVGLLSQEEINKSLDLARRAIANSETEDSPSPGSLWGSPPPQGARPGEHLSPGTPGAHKPTPVPPLPAERAERISSPASRRKPGVSPLLARPSYIRSLRRAGKHGAKAPSASAKPRATHGGRAGPQSPLCNKAATLIEELTAIFRETSKPRTRNPNGESSSPDSGYLSPKNQLSAPMSASASRSPTGDQQEVEAGAEPLEPGHHPAAARDVVQPSRSPSPPAARHLLAAPRFIQKLRSQEVAEGSRVYLECRVAGNPPPRVRGTKLFCTYL